MIEDYFRGVETLITSAAAVHSSRITYDKRSAYVGLIRGEIHLVDGSLLHVREFVNVQHGIDRYMYTYHYQDAAGNLVLRYDNAPHHRELSSFPHHKHVGSEASVEPAAQPNLKDTLIEISDLVSRSTRCD